MGKRRLHREEHGGQVRANDALERLERCAAERRKLAGFADQEDLRLRFDVLTKTKEPELHRYWTRGDREANRRLFRLAGEVIRAVEAEVFPPNPGWQCKECQYRSHCWAWQ